MKIIYCSNVCSEETYKKYFSESKVKPGQQVQKYHRIMLAGLASNDNVQVKAISKLSVQKKNGDVNRTKGFVENWHNVVIQYMPMRNIPKIGHLLQIFFTFWYVLREKKERDTVVILDVLNLSMGIGTICACRLCGIKLIGIITDLPEMLGGREDSPFVKWDKKIIDKCDGYLLLTEAMNLRVNPDGKPYVVIEGQVDSDIIAGNDFAQKAEKKICIYAGSIKRSNGIAYLVEGFLQANVADAELHIYGDGDYEDELVSICKKHTNVKFWGVRFNDEVVEAETRATLLINPRPTNQEFVKYSFPSKNMEYMSSGTPVLTTKLHGMPKDYYPHVYILEDETADGMAGMLREILSQSRETLHQKGLAAQDFVLKNKTGKAQAKKLLSLAKELLK